MQEEGGGHGDDAEHHQEGDRERRTQDLHVRQDRQQGKQQVELSYSLSFFLFPPVSLSFLTFYHA